MSLQLPSNILSQIHKHLEAAYPDEGAGLLLGNTHEDYRQVVSITEMTNSREGVARKRRYLIDPKEFLNAERKATMQGLEIIGVFHSHPDHPSEPSEFDREWALPWFSYLITSIQSGKAANSRSWRLREDRTKFLEEKIEKLIEASEK